MNNTNLITGAKTSLFSIGMFREAAPPDGSCCLLRLVETSIRRYVTL